MSPVALVALKRVLYAGQSYAAGEAFDARDTADAVVLKTLGLAIDAPAPDTSEPASQPSLDSQYEPAQVVQPAVADESAEATRDEAALESTDAMTELKRRRRKASSD